MSVIVDSRGVVEAGDGQGNLTVAGATVTNISYMTAQPLVGSASFGAPALSPGGLPGLTAIPAPGFFAVPVSGSGGPSGKGAGGFTGSLPSPATYPGGEILITDTLGQFAYLITGSISVMSSLTGSSGGGTGAGLANAVSVNGTKLTVSPGGTVGFWSDSKGWLVCAVSGTLILNA